MKQLLFILLIPFIGMTQTQFDYLGGLGMSANGTGCFFIDLNTGNTNLGINDVKFVHEGGEIYFDAVSGDSLRLPTLVPPALVGRKLWADCNISKNNFNQSRVYVVSATRKLSNGSHVLPFKYNDLYNYIVLRVSGDSVYIRGWVFNIPAETYECYQLAQIKSQKSPIIKEEE